MANASVEVLNFLDRQPAIKKCLSQRLINVSSLAKFIMQNGESNIESMNVDAVITAIRRSIEDSAKESFENKSLILRNSRLTCRNKIASIIVKKESSAMPALSNIFSSVDFLGAETLRIVKGQSTIMLLFDEELLEKITKLFNPSLIIESRKKLGVITIALSLDQQKHNAFCSILNELSINNVNVIEAVTCISEYMVFVDEKDMLKAHEILYKLCVG